MKQAKAKTAAQPIVKVMMESEVARQVRQHARSSMKAEVGKEESSTTVVEACIAGANAAQGGAHVTFTQETWEHIYQVKDSDYPDSRIVGWYHSHPGFGVFLKGGAPVPARCASCIRSTHTPGQRVSVTGD